MYVFCCIVGHRHQVAANQLMDFAPIGLTTLIHCCAKLNYNPGTGFLKVGLCWRSEPIGFASVH
jgi:hypothetical protein